MIRRRQKSCKEGVCSIQCFPHTTHCCACFSDYVHTSRIQGYLYSGGGYVLSRHCNQQQISVKTEGVLIFGGVLIYGVLRYLEEKIEGVCVMLPLDQLLCLLFPFYFTLFLGSFFVAYENLYMSWLSFWQCMP